MSFATEISTIMNANTEINNSVYGIYRETTGTEFDSKKNWIIFTYKRGYNIAVLGDKNAINIYTLYTEVYTNNGSVTETISDKLRTYLTDFTSSTITDITFTNETHSNIADSNNDVAYVNLMEFEVMAQY